MAQPVRAEGGKITWLLSDFPPAIVLEQPLPGRGYADDFLRYAAEHMPEYEHVYTRSNIARTTAMMRQGLKGCHPSMLRTPEREKIVTFSRPIHVLLPHHVIVRNDRIDRIQPYVGSDGAVVVADLIVDQNLVTAVSEKRAYPSVVRRALEEAGDKATVIRAFINSQVLFRQAAAGVIDYVIGYPNEVVWFLEGGQQSETDPEAVFEYLPIAGMPDYLVGRVGCTKGDWGQAVVDRINAMAEAAGPRPPWLDAQYRFLDEAGTARLEAIIAAHEPLAGE